MRALGIKNRAVLLALLTAAGAAAGGSSPAHAAPPTVQVREAGAVQAGGAGIAVVVVVTCPTEAGQLDLLVTATQRQADGALVRGAHYAGLVCTGASQAVRVAVSSAGYSRSDGSGPPFRPGVAFVTADLGYCVETCDTVRSGRTVRTPALLMDNARSVTPDTAVALPSSASLEADGAGVLVRVPYRCTTGRSGRMNAILVQRTSADVVSRSLTDMSFTCASTRRSVVLALPAGAAAWEAGAALLVVRGGTCGPSGCASINVHRTLALT